MDLEFEIRQAIEGHKDSFVNLIKYYEISMYKVAKSMLQSDDDCADAIQETILKAYKAISNLKQPQFFKTWLIRILINECNNIYKLKGKVIPIQEIEVTSFEKSAVNRIDDNIIVEEMLNSLDNELKNIVILFYFEGFSIKDISYLLEIPEGTVKSRLSRSRGKLRNAFKNDFMGSECYE
ncbi:sigma-70 family RNA polymerase sigma factor [Clostridium brassicae]|uniref:Sigma-70 family RNA polymerase sigma factor n=1 Tax=Clostridium brassicae TaxID=2999072 RepID=A0ABT4D883_9CLOT|nr:sigma-70 family RNA polymerase sigma factor [Clostridium brassicae]MCY6958515.1 sigma-70 family RNA polymerase sigma factor [Clostridium brassicae]